MKLSELDILFSEYIRLRAMYRVGGCERCQRVKESYKGLECSHHFGRARLALRWDESNVTGICHGCHRYLTAHPKEHVDWFKKYLGETEYLLLEARSRLIGKPDEALLTLYYNQKINEMEV